MKKLLKTIKSLSLISVGIILLALSSCGDGSDTNKGKDFVGIWESNDKYRVRIEIVEQVREGKKREERFDLIYLNKVSKDSLPENYIHEGQFNYWFTTARGKDNHHPFQEFLHQNGSRNVEGFGDVRHYFAFKPGYKDWMTRRYKPLSDVSFRRIKEEESK